MKALGIVSIILIVCALICGLWMKAHPQGYDLPYLAVRSRPGVSPGHDFAVSVQKVSGPEDVTPDELILSLTLC